MCVCQDVCKTTIFYADKMVQRVSRGQNNNAEFEITESLCLAINNIDYVLQYIQPFVNVGTWDGIQWNIKKKWTLKILIGWFDFGNNIPDFVLFSNYMHFQVVQGIPR